MGLTVAVGAPIPSLVIYHVDKSLVRSYLYEGKDQLRPITSSIIVGEVRLNKEQYEEQLKLAHSAYIVMDGSDRLFVGLNAISSDEEYADYYWFQVVAKASAEEKAWAASASKQELYDRALEKSKVFGLRFSKIVRLSKPEGMITPPLVIKDIELDFMPNRRVTLLGDAAHAMAPSKSFSFTIKSKRLTWYKTVARAAIMPCKTP